MPSLPSLHPPTHSPTASIALVLSMASLQKVFAAGADLGQFSFTSTFTLLERATHVHVEMSESRYSTLATCTVAGVPVQKLKSTRTGIVVCLAQVEGPLVNGYFCLGRLYCIYSVL